MRGTTSLIAVDWSKKCFGTGREISISSARELGFKTAIPILCRPWRNEDKQCKLTNGMKHLQNNFKNTVSNTIVVTYSWFPVFHRRMVADIFLYTDEGGEFFFLASNVL